MSRFRNFRNKITDEDIIHTYEELMRMTFDEITDRADELSSQYSQIGLPTDSELEDSPNAVFVQDDKNNHGESHWHAQSDDYVNNDESFDQSSLGQVPILKGQVSETYNPYAKGQQNDIYNVSNIKNANYNSNNYQNTIKQSNILYSSVSNDRTIDDVQNETWTRNGKLQELDGNNNPINNTLNLTQKIANKLLATGYNVDSWVNKPSEAMDKIKTDIALNILLGNANIGSGATLKLAKAITPFIGEKVAPYVAKDAGNGLVTGTLSGLIHSIENGLNPISQMLKEGTIDTLKGGAKGYTKGKINQFNEENDLLEKLKELLGKIIRNNKR